MSRSFVSTVHLGFSTVCVTEWPQTIDMRRRHCMQLGAAFNVVRCCCNFHVLAGVAPSSPCVFPPMSGSMHPWRPSSCFVPRHPSSSACGCTYQERACICVEASRSLRYSPIYLARYPCACQDRLLHHIVSCHCAAGQAASRTPASQATHSVGCRAREYGKRQGTRCPTVFPPQGSIDTKSTDRNGLTSCRVVPVVSNNAARSSLPPPPLVCTCASPITSPGCT